MYIQVLPMYMILKNSFTCCAGKKEEHCDLHCNNCQIHGDYKGLLYLFFIFLFSRIIQRELIVRSARCLTTDQEIKLVNTKMLANVCLLIPAIIIIIFLLVLPVVLAIKHGMRFSIDLYI